MYRTPPRGINYKCTKFVLVTFPQGYYLSNVFKLHLMTSVQSLITFGSLAIDASLGRTDKQSGDYMLRRNSSRNIELGIPRDFLVKWCLIKISRCLTV